MQQLVLKEGDIFIVTDEYGNIPENTPLGLYYHDTRYLSLLNLKVNGTDPELLNSTSGQNFMSNLQFANTLFHLDGGTVVLPQTISIRRNRLVRGGLYERIGCMNYNRFPVTLTLLLEMGADFRDMFDVRGFARDRWGELRPPVLDDTGLHLGYLGLDGVERQTHIRFSRPPDNAELRAAPSSQPTSSEAGIMIPVVDAEGRHPVIQAPRAVLTWRVTLAPQHPFALSMHVYPESLGATEPEPPFDQAVQQMRRSYSGWQAHSSEITTSSESFTRLLARSSWDLRVLSEELEQGYFPSAGIPWYACPFGRDSLITALQSLMLNPGLAVGTLRVLARHQGKVVDAWREEEPGKILHEVRFGEMARLQMVPHTPYYGTVDATPLFVMLFVETMRWLHDEQLYADLLPNVLRAIDWIDQYGDKDGDGFVEYVASRSNGGIRNQIWKDSDDSTQFPDGTLAETPIAACEVQGYVYAAKLGLSELLREHGDTARADRLAAEAATLRARFNERFWMPAANYYAQGLDARKVQIPTITSNPGHCLWAGICDEDKAEAVARRLIAPDMASGWGVRTISSRSPSYNPMSYHNGSIWPHDNSIVIAGLRRYGRRDAALQAATQLYQAGLHFRYYRLPELFCGFDRDDRYGAGPAEYPVSCSPQAWAAGAPLLLIQSLLGLEPGPAGEPPRLDPWLPAWLTQVMIRHLRIGARRYQVEIQGGPDAPPVVHVGESLEEKD